MEETAGVMADLYQAGKIRAIGVSNFDVAQMDAFRAVAPLHANQPPYHLFERALGDAVLPYCAEHVTDPAGPELMAPAAREEGA